ncbi:MAG: glutamate 5-kinase [Gammaproteobacteria bacterium]|nr:glutamate 5-kinase [Gammaproteobacteria bacterium]
MTRHSLIDSQRWVVKIGSALITDDGKGLDLQAMQAWAKQMAELHQQGHQLILVSSGSVAEGMSRFGWQTRPNTLHELQAAAAVGQMGLVQAYESSFQTYQIRTAQILLTHDDLADRQRYLNARSTLRTLLKLGVIPIINENDTVATDEIRFGDNDTLGALVANLVEADTLVILTDQEGLFDQDPRHNPNAQLIQEGKAEDSNLLALAGPSAGTLGRGGMTTKILAAARAARSGSQTVIASGRETDVLPRLKQGERIGTLLTPSQEPLMARKQWLANQLKVRGQLHLDAGASRMIQQNGSSLLAVGIKDVSGHFVRGDVVACLDQNGNEIARGLVNYSALETQKIKGQSSQKIAELLGYVDEPELIHRDNLALTR